MKVLKIFLLSLWCVLGAMLLGPETGGAEEKGCETCGGE